MPRIPIYTSQGIRSQPQYTSNVHAQSPVNVGDLAKQVSDIANENAKQYFNAVAQQQSLEFSQKKAEFDAGEIEIQNRLSTDEKVLANPQVYHQRYIEEVNKLDSALGKTVVSGEGAKRAYNAYVTRRMPALAVEAQTRQVNLLNANNIASLDNQQDILSGIAATAEDPAKRVEASRQYEFLVDSAYSRGAFKTADGLPDPIKREARIRKFHADVATKRMNYLLDTDYNAILDGNVQGEFNAVDPTVRAHYLDLATKKGASIDKESARVMSNVEDVVWNWAQSEAMNGRLPAAYVKDIEDGKNPFIKDPSKANALRRLAEGTNTGNTEYDDEAVRIIMYSYRNGSSTDNEAIQSRLNTARAQLNNYVERNGGIPNKSTAKAMNELQSDELGIAREKRSLESTGRAQQLFTGSVAAQGRAELHERQRSAKEIYRSKVKNNKMLQTFTGDPEIEDTATINRALASDPKLTPDDAVNQLIEQKNAKRKDRSEEQKARDRILERRRGR